MAGSPELCESFSGSTKQIAIQQMRHEVSAFTRTESHARSRAGDAERSRKIADRAKYLCTLQA
jgi:hypothetical protein